MDRVRELRAVPRAEASLPAVKERHPGSDWRPAMTTTENTDGRTALLEAMSNLTEYHREHEKYYGAAPREQAVVLQRHARTLQALADRWTTVAPLERQAFSPY